MKHLFFSASLFVLWINCPGQNVGIGTTSPQATLDVKGNHRLGGLSSFITYDSATGRIEWKNSNLYVPVTQALMKHSAAADGLFYNNTAPVSGQLEYRNAAGEPVFYTNFTNGNGYFKNFLGIGTSSPFTNLHIESNNSFPVVVNGAPNLYLSWAENNNYRGYLGSYAGNPEDVDFGTYSGNATGKVHFTTQAIPRMTIGASGNVGIGTAAPSEKLQVSGSVKADNFVYSSPKTLYYNLSGIDFRGERSRDTVILSIGSGSIFVSHTTSTSGIIAPVHLPQGAVMGNMTIYFSDFSGAQNLQAVFYRKTILSNIFPDNIGAISSSGSSGLAAYTTPVNFLSNVVDNTIYTYYLHIYTTPFPSVWSSSALELRAVVIEYTLASAQ